MSTTEERIAEALSAFSGGITMDTSTMEKRFTEVREQGARDRRRRRGIAVGATALVAAAALIAAFTLGGGLLGDDDRALPEVAEQPEVVDEVQPASGEGFPLEGATYSVAGFPVPFRFTVPAKGDVPGKWHYGGANPFGINLDNSPSTGHAMVELMSLTETYDSSRPWFEQRTLVPAPTDAAGWISWLQTSGKVTITEQQKVEIDGLPATRMVVDANDLPRQPARGSGVLALTPIGNGTVGDGLQAGIPDDLHVELTVVEAGDRTVLIVSSGAPETKDAWAPLMQEVVDSLQFD